MIHPDTDGGGAPDGAEDRNLNGALDSGETDPINPSDDPTCSSNVPIELDAPPVSGLRVVASGSDVVLTWSDARAVDACILYRVYVAVDAYTKSDASSFGLLATTGEPSYRHTGAAMDQLSYDYLIVGFSLAEGEGTVGHYGQ